MKCNKSVHPLTSTHPLSPLSPFLSRIKLQMEEAVGCHCSGAELEGVVKREASGMEIVSSEMANSGWAGVLLVRNVIYAHGASQIHRRNLVRAAVCHCGFFHHHRCSEVSGGIIWCATPGTTEMEKNKWLGVWSAWDVGILKLSQLITECNLWQCRTDSWDRADLINYGGDIFLFPLIFCSLKNLITLLHLARSIQNWTFFPPQNM